MTSAINPNNIDGAYPVAGQDNNSQGFRDNFTNTATNFQFAADEISDLQATAVLKQALVGTTLDNNMLGSPLSNALLSNMSEAVVALGTVSGTTIINYALGSYQTLTTNGAVSLQFSNLPAAGAAASVVVQVYVANTIHTVTFPVSVSLNNLGIQGATISGSGTTISFATIGYYSFEFTTSNSGSTVITVNEINKRLQPFNYSSENLASTSASNLALTTSYFSTVTSSTATLAAGVNGQIKTFIMYEESGNMVITVTNAGWGGAGTITFNATGEGCTLQYINAKWFCIGNNGAAFA
jgi:hypothetical protein